MSWGLNLWWKLPNNFNHASLCYELAWLLVKKLSVMFCVDVSLVQSVAEQSQLKLLCSCLLKLFDSHRSMFHETTLETISNGVQWQLNV
jgi:hypothetical protein